MKNFMYLGLVSYSIFIISTPNISIKDAVAANMDVGEIVSKVHSSRWSELLDKLKSDDTKAILAVVGGVRDTLGITAAIIAACAFFYNWMCPQKFDVALQNRNLKDLEEIEDRREVENKLNDCIKEYLQSVILDGEYLREATLPAPCHDLGAEYGLLASSNALMEKKIIYTNTFNEKLRDRYKE